VFAVAAVSKLADWAGSRQAVEHFGVPRRVSGLAAVLLSTAELGIAVGLLPSAIYGWAAFGALTLLIIFMVGIGVTLARGQRPECHCFGQLHSAPVGWRTLVRNGVLATVAALVVWQGSADPGASDVAWLLPLSETEIAGLVAIVILAALVALEGWLGLNLLRQQGRLLIRLEALEQATRSDAQGTPLAHAEAVQAPALGLPVGGAAPDFELAAIDGQLVTLEALRAGGKPVVLLFTDPGCGPCSTLHPDIARWQHDHADKFTLALISSGTPKAHRAKASEF